MTEKNEKLLSSLMYKQVGNDWVGRTKNLFFKFHEDDRTEDLLIEISLTSIDSRGLIIDLLDAAVKNHDIENYQVATNIISITCCSDTDSIRLKDLLSMIAEKCISTSIHNVCENCENTSFLDFYTNNFKAILLCRDCYHYLDKQIEESKKTPNNYIRGLFGSLVGAIIGSVVWIGIGAIGFYASIAGYAISFSSFKGYEIVKGKKTIIGIVINIFTVVFALIFAQYLGIFIDIVKEYPDVGFLQYILATPALFSDASFLKEIIPSMAFGFIFAILGSYRTIKANYQQANTNDKLQLEKVDV